MRVRLRVRAQVLRAAAFCLVCHVACAAVGAGIAWTAIALGWHVRMGDAWVIGIGGALGWAAPWVYLIAGRQLGASGDVSERYERRR